MKMPEFFLYDLLKNDIIFYAWHWLVLYTFFYVFVVLHKNNVELWPYCTRCLAMSHAIGNVYLASKIIYTFGIYEVWDYKFYLRWPNGVNMFNNINGFMGGYLMVDAFYLLINNYRNPKNVDGNFMTVTHHVVGASSMVAFIWTGQVQFNSLYYSMTEISTIPLHISWILLKLNLNKKPGWQTLFLSCCTATTILFLVVRIFGSFFVWAYINENILAIASLHWISQIYAFLGNSIITILNFVWFAKLIRMAWKTLKS